MRTLGKKVTVNFFTNPETGFQDLEKHWSEIMNDKEKRNNVPSHLHLAYAMLRGKDYTKGFAELSEEAGKRRNPPGRDPGLHAAIGNLFSSRKGTVEFFNGIIKEDAITQLAQMVSNKVRVNPYQEPAVLTVPAEKEKIEVKSEVKKGVKQWLTNMFTPSSDKTSA